MFLVIGKRWRSDAMLCICAAVVLFGFFAGRTSCTVPVFSSMEGQAPTVVIDPGHGGVDSGAVSKSGVQESRLNLEIALRCYDLLRLTGQNTVLTRSDEDAIHTEGETIRARKASDTRNRVKLVEETERAVLLSIHQNSFPSSLQTHGAQVFWNHDEDAEQLAKIIQDALNSCINTERPKQAKKIQPTIYLMNHVTAPAVLVECGFLTNGTEAELLQQSDHQQMLAAAITAGYLRALSGEDVP